MISRTKLLAKSSLISILALMILSQSSVQAQTSPTDYLMICDNAIINNYTLNSYNSWIRDLNQWTTKKVGINEVGHTADSIKNYIRNEFNTSNGALKYVVFFGSNSVIPVPVISNVKSDLWYGCLDSTDLRLPKVAIGRFPTSSNAVLQAMLYKTYYFANRNLGSSWAKGVTFISADSMGTNDYKEIQDYLNTGLTNTYHDLSPRANFTYEVIDGATADSSSITSMFNNGRCLVHFNGAGSTGNWLNWNFQDHSFGAEEIEWLSNLSQTPVILSSADYTGDITGDCLGEAFVVHSNSNNRAVAFVGPYHNLYKNKNGNLNMVTLISSAMIDHKASIGWAINYAVYHMARIYKNDSQADHDMKVITCIGEPSLNLFNVKNHIVRTGQPASTIQAKVDQASEGDVIWIEPGTYTLTGAAYSNDGHGNDSATIYVEKGITIKSLYGAENTIIDGNKQRLHFRLMPINSIAIIDGLTLQNGYSFSTGVDYRTGSIFVGGVCRDIIAVISNCIFKDNKSDWTAGCVYAHDGSTFLNNCVLFHSKANDFGDIFCRTGDEAAGLVARNNTSVLNNKSNSIFHHNAIQYLNYPNNMTEADPLFEDFYNYNFRLKSQSPFIDASTEAIPAFLFDLAGNRRLKGAALDKGAYEYQGN